MRYRLLSLALCILCAAGCVRERQKTEEATPKPRTAEEAAAELGNPLLANKGDINAINYNVSTTEQLESIDNGAGEELIWTNPDDPDAEIPELTEAFQNKWKGNGWQTDMKWAIKLARRQELPLLIWFHDSVVSPKSNALGREYLNTPEFNDWSNGRIVRLRLDSGTSLDDATADKAKYSYRQINALQQRYGLKKKPSFVIITPDGKIVERIDGFDGFLSGFILDLQNAVKLAEKEYRTRRADLQEYGYREWQSARGDKKVFAKFVRYDEEKQIVYLKESGGRVSRTKLSSFSREDADYLLELAEQKKKKKKKHEQQI